jgi:hypothetical protein
VSGLAALLLLAACLVLPLGGRLPVGVGVGEAGGPRRVRRTGSRASARAPWAAGSDPAVPGRRGPRVRLGRGARADSAWVAEFADVVAVGLESGLTTVDAVALAADIGRRAGGEPGAEAAPRGSHAGRAGSAAGSTPWDLLVAVAAQARMTGQDLGPLLAQSAPQLRVGADELGFLARAWTLSAAVGAPAAPAARLVGTTLRSRQRRREQAAALVAGPRASMWLLTLLPMLGPVAVALSGGDVLAIYAAPGPALLVALGLALTGTGWLWCRSLLRRAARPRTVTESRS